MLCRVRSIYNKSKFCHVLIHNVEFDDLLLVNMAQLYNQYKNKMNYEINSLL